MNVTSRFDGAVHDQAAADIGRNRQGERVVRLELTYSRGTAPSSTTLMLAESAAWALRRQLEELADAIVDGTIADDGRDRVRADDACPNCGERELDNLVWQADATTVRCVKCGTRYAPAGE